MAAPALPASAPAESLKEIAGAVLKLPPGDDRDIALLEVAKSASRAGDLQLAGELRSQLVPGADLSPLPEALPPADAHNLESGAELVAARAAILQARHDTAALERAMTEEPHPFLQGRICLTVGLQLARQGDTDTAWHWFRKAAAALDLASGQYANRAEADWLRQIKEPGAGRDSPRDDEADSPSTAVPELLKQAVELTRRGEMEGAASAARRATALAAELSSGNLRRQSRVSALEVFLHLRLDEDITAAADLIAPQTTGPVRQALARAIKRGLGAPLHQAERELAPVRLLVEREELLARRQRAFVRFAGDLAHSRLPDIRAAAVREEEERVRHHAFDEMQMKSIEIFVEWRLRTADAMEMGGNEPVDELTISYAILNYLQQTPALVTELTLTWMAPENTELSPALRALAQQTLHRARRMPEEQEALTNALLELPEDLMEASSTADLIRAHLELEEIAEAIALLDALEHKELLTRMRYEVIETCVELGLLERAWHQVLLIEQQPLLQVICFRIIATAEHLHPVELVDSLAGKLQISGSAHAPAIARVLADLLLLHPGVEESHRKHVAQARRLADSAETPEAKEVRAELDLLQAARAATAQAVRENSPEAAANFLRTIPGAAMRRELLLHMIGMSVDAGALEVARELAEGAESAERLMALARIAAASADGLKKEMLP